MVLNGHIIKLGSFEDVLSNGAEDRWVKIGFALDPSYLIRPITVGDTGERTYLWRRGSNIESITAQYTFSATGEGKDREISLLHPKLSSASITTASGEEEMIREFSVRHTELLVDDRIAKLNLSKEKLTRADISALEFETIKPTPHSVYRPTRSYSEISGGRPSGAVLQHFLPSRIQVVYDEVLERARNLVTSLLAPDTYRHTSRDFSSHLFQEIPPAFLQEVQNLIAGFLQNYERPDEESTVSRLFRNQTNRALDSLGLLLDEPTYEKVFDTLSSLPTSVKRQIGEIFAEKYESLVQLAKGNEKPSFQVGYFLPNEEIDAGVELVHVYFSKLVRYLGPLRDEPKPVYPLSGTTDTRDVGFRGEFTAAVLDVHKDTEVDFVNPNDFVEGYSVVRATRVSLYFAVLEWLKYMGVANVVSTTDRGKLGHELKVQPSGGSELHDLTHVGVGVSQVLPILVMCLLADQGSTLIFEQPELHLHPKVQTRLADFFVSMILLNKQCIVETHSEYLINRLRYQVAISENEFISSQIIMYFVEREQNQSVYRSVRINRYGVIDDWPRGFFDEGDDLASAVLRASVSKKKRAVQK